MKLWIKQSAPLLLALLAFAPGITRAQMDYVEVRDPAGTVRRFSRLFMGTDHLEQSDWVVPGQAASSREQVFAVLDEAVRRGINVIDTSPIYVGGVEHLVGDWLKSRQEAIRSDSFYEEPGLNPDRRVYVISKGGFPYDLFYTRRLEPGQHSPELLERLQKEGFMPSTPPGGLASAVTLKDVPPGTYASRLYGDRAQIQRRVGEELGFTRGNLDGGPTVYYLHRDDFDSIRFEVVPRDQAPVKEILSALSSDDLQGRFPILGLSNWTSDRVDEAVRIGRENPALRSPMFSSPYFSLFEMSSRTIHARGVQVTHADMMDPRFEKGVLLAPYSPLGGFSILDKPQPSWENAKADALRKFQAGDPYWQNVYYAIFTPENEARYRRAAELARRLSQADGTQVTVDQVLNAYALAHPRTDFLTVGPITAEQVQRTVQALGLSRRLKPSDLEFLHRADEPVEAAAVKSGAVAESRSVPMFVTPPTVPDQILVEVTIDDVEHVLLRVDTAAPRTTLPPRHLAELGIAPGPHQIWLGTKKDGIHIGQRLVGELEATGTGPIDVPGVPRGSIIRGTAGTDLWKGFLLGLDCQNRRLTLTPRASSAPLDPNSLVRPPDTGAPFLVDAELVAAEPNEGRVLLVSTSFDKSGASGSFLVDTGSNTNLALDQYWKRVSPGSERYIPLDLTDFLGEPISGAYKLGSSFSLSGRKLSDDAPAWVLERFPVLEYEARHFQRPIDGLIGLWTLFDHYAVLDFGEAASPKGTRIFLFPNVKAASLEAENFTGFGVLVPDATMAVRTVKGSFADLRGVRDGDILLGASGPALEFASTGVIRGKPGESRTFQFRRGAADYSVLLHAERLLHGSSSCRRLFRGLPPLRP